MTSEQQTTKKINCDGARDNIFVFADFPTHVWSYISLTRNSLLFETETQNEETENNSSESQCC